MRKINEISQEFVMNVIPARAQDSHKGSFGSVLNIAGSKNYMGAAYLSSLSALRAGCGYVTLASIEPVIESVAAKTSEVVFYYTRQDDYTISAKSVRDLIKLSGKHKVVSIGCGLSTTAYQDNEIDILVNDFFEEQKDSDKIFVIDADALNSVSRLKNFVFPKNSVLTPHPKELSRLLNIEVEEILADRIKYAEIAADKFGATVVVKGHETVIADEENVYVNRSGNSALAKAGSGDVLTGIIAGFAAQGTSPAEAAALAVYLHGLAGKLAAEKMTQYGVVASDLIEYLPAAIKHLFSIN